MSAAAAKAGEPHTTGTTAIAADLLMMVGGVRLSLNENEETEELSKKQLKTKVR